MGPENTVRKCTFGKAAGLVVVFGYSDDLMEFRGAIDDEIGAYEGGTAHITPKGLLCAPDSCDDPNGCPYFQKEQESASLIEAIWGEDGYSWTYKTDIPHATFDILDDNEKYCRGIVFDMLRV